MVLRALEHTAAGPMDVRISMELEVRRSCGCPPVERLREAEAEITRPADAEIARPADTDAADPARAPSTRAALAQSGAGHGQVAPIGAARADPAQPAALMAIDRAVPGGTPAHVA
jgi:hypothetical protein